MCVVVARIIVVSGVDDNDVYIDNSIVSFQLYTYIYIENVVYMCMYVDSVVDVVGVMFGDGDV